MDPAEGKETDNLVLDSIHNSLESSDLQEHYADELSGDEEVEDIESSEDEDEEVDNNYSRNNFAPPDTEFRDVDSIRPEFGIDEESEGLEILQLFFDETIMSKIVEETNRYGESISLTNNKWQWKETNASEMWRFLAVCILMGIVKKPSIRDYWSSHVLLSTPAFGKIMSRDR